MSTNDLPPPDPQTKNESELQHHDNSHHPKEPDEIIQQPAKRTTPTPPKSPSEVGSFHSAEDEQTETEQTNQTELKSNSNETNALDEPSSTRELVQADNQCEIKVPITEEEGTQKTDEQTIEMQPFIAPPDVPIQQPSQVDVLNEQKNVIENTEAENKVECLIKNESESKMTSEEKAVLPEQQVEIVEEKTVLPEQQIDEEIDKRENTRELIEDQAQKDNNQDVDEIESTHSKPAEVSNKNEEQEPTQIGDENEIESGDENEDEDEEKSGEDEDDEQKELDEDEIKESPAYIPKQGHFYMHDDARSVPPEHHNVFTSSEDEEIENTDKPQNNDENEVEEPGKNAISGQDESSAPPPPKSRADRVDHWKHDMFDERSQAPKNSRDLIRRYGRDIRRDDDDDENEDRDASNKNKIESNKRSLNKRPSAAISQSQRHSAVTVRGSRISGGSSRARGRTTTAARSAVSSSVGRGGRIVVNRSQNNNTANIPQQRSESCYNDSARNDSVRRKGRFHELRQQQQPRQEVPDSWDNDDNADSDAGWGKGDDQNLPNEDNYPPLPNRGRQTVDTQSQSRNRSNADKHDKKIINATQQQRRRSDANDRHAQTQKNNWQQQHPQTRRDYYNTNTTGIGGRSAASDLFDDNNKNTEMGSGGFGRSHRTEAPPSQREGRFAMGSTARDGRMTTGHQNRGGGNIKGGGTYYQQTSQIPREGRFAGQHQQNNQQSPRGTSDDNNGRFGGGSQRGRGLDYHHGGAPRRSPNREHSNNVYRGNGQSVHEQRRPAEQQQQELYPHPRQPTEPVFFDTAEQQTRRSNQQPPPRRERRRLPIQSP